MCVVVGILGDANVNRQRQAVSNALIYTIGTYIKKKQLPLTFVIIFVTSSLLPSAMNQNITSKLIEASNYAECVVLKIINKYLMSNI